MIAIPFAQVLIGLNSNVGQTSLHRHSIILPLAFQKALYRTDHGFDEREQIILGWFLLLLFGAVMFEKGVKQLRATENRGCHESGRMRDPSQNIHEQSLTGGIESSHIAPGPHPHLGRRLLELASQLCGG